MRHPYPLAIDFGTTYTAAAVRIGERVSVLELHGASRMSSAVFLTAEGELVIGADAEQRATSAPERFERSPKLYMDVGESGLILGDELLDVRDVVGRMMRDVWDEAVRQQDGEPPSEVRLTHPASWRAQRKAMLREAAVRGGLPEPVLVPEPEAAALYLASAEVTGAAIADGDLVAVYDLGGGTLDTAVLRRSGARFELVGEPGGDPGIGGSLFDDRLYRHLGETGLDPADWDRLQGAEDREWRRANHEFRREVQRAKEAVSRAAAHPVYVPSPVDVELQVTREELETLIRPDIGRSIAILDDTIASAGVDASALQRVFLTGGSSRIPLVAQLVKRRFGRADFKGDPKTVVALGAAQQPDSAARPAPDEAAPGPPASGRARRRGLVAGAAAIAAAIVAAIVVMAAGGDSGDAPSDTSGTAAAQEATDTIRPGKSIGPVNLGDSRKEIERVLGRGQPTADDPDDVRWQLANGFLAVQFMDGAAAFVATNNGEYTIDGTPVSDEADLRKQVRGQWQECPDARMIVNNETTDGPGTAVMWRDKGPETWVAALPMDCELAEGAGAPAE